MAVVGLSLQAPKPLTGVGLLRPAHLFEPVAQPDFIAFNH